MPKSVYLDCHTATSPLPAAVDALLPFLRDQWGANHSEHPMVRAHSSIFVQGTKAILALLGARASDKFYFFSSSEEAMFHLYFCHYLQHIRTLGKNHILTTNTEEVPLLLLLDRLENLGCYGKPLPVNAQGQLTQEILQTALQPRTALLSISWANGLTGVIQPVSDLAQICRAKGVLLHVDATYVIGKLYFRLEDLGIDYVTFEGSLVHAPKGTGGLVVQEHTPISPPLSTATGVSLGGIASLAQALQGTGEKCDQLCLETARLRDRLEKGVQQGLPNARVCFQHVERLSNCTTMIFPGAASEALLFLLHRRGVYASMGGGRHQPLSHLLEASGIDTISARCALSFSLSFETTEEEIDYAIVVIVESAKQLQSISGSWLIDS